MSDNTFPLPTSDDDPALDHWYHTIDLPGGIATHGEYDHRPVVPLYGLPSSMAGMSALDVGTADGFWAFELERRRADKVAAVDVERWGDFDWTPQVRKMKGRDLDKPMAANFMKAHSWRRSQVEHVTGSIYDLTPERPGTFDLVFCGSLLLHLMAPLRALAGLRAVTKRVAIIETIVDDKLDDQTPEHPWIHFGVREVEKTPGENCFYWRFSTRALEEMLIYAGFSRVERRGRFKTPFRSSTSGPSVEAARRLLSGLARRATGRPEGPGWTHAVVHAYV